MNYWLVDKGVLVGFLSSVSKTEALNQHVLICPYNSILYMKISYSTCIFKHSYLEGEDHYLLSWYKFYHLNYQVYCKCWMACDVCARSLARDHFVEKRPIWAIQLNIIDFIKFMRRLCSVVTLFPLYLLQYQLKSVLSSL